MCGRFANAQPIPQYRAAVREQLPDRRDPTPAPDADDYTPSHNVAPQTRCPVVRRELSWERERRLRHTTNPTPEDRQFQMIIQTMKWGLIPRFHKTPPSYGEAYKTINARDDTILSPQRSMWHSLLPAQRCVVFVQGFFEWQKRGAEGDKVERIPHFVGMTEPGHGRADKLGHEKRLMPLAGLWERVRFEGEDKPLYTFTIVTTASNDQLGFLHDRMPVILPTQEAIATWLGLGAEPKSDAQVKEGMNVDDSWSTEVAKLLRPLQAELECYKVPKEVGKVGNSDPSFLLPVEERRDGLKAFFAKQTQAKSDSHSDSVGHEAEKAKSSTHTSGSDVVASGNAEESDTVSQDTVAIMATEQAEEEAALVEAAARAEQEEADRKLAEQMQRELENDSSSHESVVDAGESSRASSRATSVVTIDDDDSVEADEVGDGFGVPEHVPRDDSASDRASKRTRVEPSSRFSPDPYNPPVSPPRPRGGYSRKLSPASGGGIHVTPPRRKKGSRPHEPFPQAPPHTWSSPKKERERGDIGDMLKKQAAKQPRSPPKANDATSSGGGRRKDAAKGADIRAFFSPTKPTSPSK
jgi:putative SOS response-associated peptidase YedK